MGIVKEISVLPLSGEIPRTFDEDKYDFLIVGHSQHKGASYPLNILQNEIFAGSRIAVLGVEGRYQLETELNASHLTYSFFSNVTDNEIFEIMNNSKVIIMNSKFGTEGFGLPVAQGIYLNKNVVTSRDPALLETGKGYSHFFSGNINQDTDILIAAVGSPSNFKNLYSYRTWEDVMGDLLDILKLDS